MATLSKNVKYLKGRQGLEFFFLFMTLIRLKNDKAAAVFNLIRVLD